jgi:hypothetical protein
MAGNLSVFFDVILLKRHATRLVLMAHDGERSTDRYAGASGRPAQDRMGTPYVMEENAPRGIV